VQRGRRARRIGQDFGIRRRADHCTQDACAEQRQPQIVSHVRSRLSVYSVSVIVTRG
jgi:hypothetical protein